MPSMSSAYYGMPSFYIFPHTREIFGEDYDFAHTRTEDLGPSVTLLMGLVTAQTGVTYRWTVNLSDIFYQGEVMIEEPVLDFIWGDIEDRIRYKKIKEFHERFTCIPI